MNYKIVGSTAVATAILGVIVALCFIVGDGAEVRALHFAVLGASTSLGWLTGVLVSPYDPREAREFPKHLTSISAFVSGYLVSKIDRVLEHMLSPELLLSTVAGFRALAGVCGFTVAVLVTYIYRAYAR